MFQRDRDAEYDEIAAAARALAGGRLGRGAAAAAAPARRGGRARPFDAPGRADAEHALARRRQAPARQPRPGHGPGPPSAARRDVGHPPPPQGRPPLERLAHPPLHRPGGALRLRRPGDPPPLARPAALRHVRGRVRPRRRALHLRDAARPLRARRARRSRDSPRWCTTSTSRSRATATRRRPAWRRWCAGWSRRTRRRRSGADPLLEALYPSFPRRGTAMPLLEGLVVRPARRRGGGELTGPVAGTPAGRADPVGAALRVWCARRRALLRRAGGADRRDAPHPRRREALGEPAALPPRAQLLHAAAGTRGAAARHLPRLAAARHGGGLVAGTLFVLPGFVSILALSCPLRRPGRTPAGRGAVLRA